ncbi:SDR family oxidoreductase [Roseomonas sp. CAU 1739]|uniref:SDR family NAD(P)-dependent oxidoreductase n=1 Tax=Roseomonas sp. CAU 1739 TaxID=3140364 RepID=UPI00325C286C
MSATSHSVALITGASSGIGAVYADRLAHRGRDLLLVARDATRLEALASRLRAETGRKVEVLPADLARPDDLARIERRLRDDAAIGMLVNNAGMAVGGTVAGADAGRLADLVQLNVVAASRLAVAAAQAFADRRHGTLVNIASVLALTPEGFNGVYNATKSFVLTLTQSLQAELAGTGLRIQAVLPGATRTEIWGRAGIDDATLPAEMVMGVDEMVDAALAGLDSGEAVTIPSLPDAADWQRFEAARLALAPNLSRNHAAARYLRQEPAA